MAIEKGKSNNAERSEDKRPLEVVRHPAAVPGTGAAITHAHILYPEEYQRGEVDIYRAPGHEEGMPLVRSAEEAAKSEEESNG